MAMRLDASGGRWVLTTLEVLRQGRPAAGDHRPVG
jgi:hypothetical protein